MSLMLLEMLSVEEHSETTSIMDKLMMPIIAKLRKAFLKKSRLIRLFKIIPLPRQFRRLHPIFVNLHAVYRAVLHVYRLMRHLPDDLIMRHN